MVLPFHNNELIENLTASYFSFNDPNGMCPDGLGKVIELDIDTSLDKEKSWNQGMVDLPAFHPGNWYYKQYIKSGLFDPDKKLKDYTEQEHNLLFYGAYEKDGERVNKRVEGIHNHFSRLLLKRDTSSTGDAGLKRLNSMVHQKECSVCGGRRLNETAVGNGRG